MVALARERATLRDAGHRLRDRSLEPRKREVECIRIPGATAALQHRPRKRVAPGISAPRGGLDGWPARVGHPEELGDLVERLAGCVVARLAEKVVPPPLRHPEEHGVAPRNEERHKGRNGMRILQHGTEKVSLHVVDRYPGNAQRKGGGARPGNPNEQGADEPRGRRHGDRANPGAANVRFFEGRGHDRFDPSEMVPGGQFGDHASVDPVHVL